MSSTGNFSWYDLWTTELDAAKAFYTKAIGWTLQTFEGAPGSYQMWVAGDRPIGGSGPLSPEMEGAGAQPHWTGFVTVDDADDAAARAVKLGGKILLPGTDIPGVGRFAVIRDPQGALLALVAYNRDPGEPPQGMEPGLVAWHELHTTDTEAAWRFYSELLGWKNTSTMDMGPSGPYLMFRHVDAAEDRPMGGIFNGARERNAPASWLYYFAVDALEPAMERIRGAKGQVHVGPMDVPGGGRVAICSDPQGGPFAVFAFK